MQFIQRFFIIMITILLVVKVKKNTFTFVDNESSVKILDDKNKMML